MHEFRIVWKLPWLPTVNKSCNWYHCCVYNISSIFDLRNTLYKFTLIIYTIWILLNTTIYIYINHKHNVQYRFRGQPETNHLYTTKANRYTVTKQQKKQQNKTDYWLPNNSYSTVTDPPSPPTSTLPYRILRNALIIIL